jgi:prepilin-type N-terminal cleavage/methylation domain-containing protein
MRADYTDGFTFFEVIITVALVAIMAVAVAPPLIQSLNENKLNITKSDAEILGNAMIAFYRDVGEWPNGDTGSGALERLVSNSRLGGGNNGIPAGDMLVEGSTKWARLAAAGTFNDHLMRNATDNISRLYMPSDHPHIKPGWNGPYLENSPLDPWNNPYVASVRRARSILTNEQAFGREQYTVVVLSAGPNEVFETPYVDDMFSETFGGDDIGFVGHTASTK